MEQSNAFPCLERRRTCRICGADKPLEEFRPRDKSRGTYRRECYECFKEAMRGRYHADPHKHRERMRRHVYGLAEGEYERMLADQGGRCAICGGEETSTDRRSGKIRGLFVDHCHETGEVRGLLCQRCNFGIGQFRDDAALLRQAIVYLNSP